LVDLRAYPPHVGAIHRSVEGLTLADAVAAASPDFDVVDLPVAEVEHQLAGLARGQLLLVDRLGAARMSARDPAAVAAEVALRNPSGWASLGIALSDTVLLARMSRVAEDVTA